jgi:thiamine-monophosphate kinase
LQLEIDLRFYQTDGLWLKCSIVEQLLHQERRGRSRGYFGTIAAMLSEFELIARYFDRPQAPDGVVKLGVGDDCALLAPPAGQTLAVSTDMLVEGRHFFAGADPEKLGHKALAVNLSDLAAMGAKPMAFTLALALPSANEAWLAGFARGLFALADAQGIRLIGGDTTRGPLNLCITVMGSVPEDQALRRDGAKHGDDLWVSGTLGDARLALEVLQGKIALPDDLLALAEERLHRPTPRCALGMALRGMAHAAVDVSDGLMGDLGHLLARSQMGAEIHAASLPAGPALSRQQVDRQTDYMLNGGDDYELCFTAPPGNRDAILSAAASANTSVTRIGSIKQGAGIQILDAAGRSLPFTSQSFDHFGKDI